MNSGSVGVSHIYLGIHLVVLIVVVSLMDRLVPKPYMDEIFHIPQAQQYCNGNYLTWDPKLTTPPGLYVVSNILLAVTRPFCSTYFLRMTNLVYPILLYYSIAALLKKLHPTSMTKKDRYATAAVLVFFPLTWFFNFLYYTDGGSAVLILASWLAAKHNRQLLAALGCAASVTFRQTNIIWALFIVGTTLLEHVSVEERRRYDSRAVFLTRPSQIVNGVLAFLNTLFCNPTRTIVLTAPYIALLAGFAYFVRWNGGIVLGDRSNHVASFHLVQLFYFAGFSAFFSIFAILGVVPFARLIPRRITLRTYIQIFFVGLVMVGCVNKFTSVHPFLLADNRHYTFYVWKTIFGYHWIVRYALIPGYMIAAWFCWQAIATEQTILWMLIFSLATALTLVPSPLMEFRYFITPYLIYRISMRQPKGVWLLLEALLYASINAFTLWMFFYRPFTWPGHAGYQRFMW